MSSHAWKSQETHQKLLRKIMFQLNSKEELMSKSKSNTLKKNLEEWKQLKSLLQQF